MLINILSHKYTCFLCGSNKTTLKSKKYERWYNYFNNKICHNCFLKTKGDRNPNRKINNNKHNKNRLAFRDKRFLLDWNPRNDICSNCGEFNKKTNMHHSLGYYIIFPWYGIIELCPSCHRKEELNNKC